MPTKPDLLRALLSIKEEIETNHAGYNTIMQFRDNEKTIPTGLEVSLPSAEGGRYSRRVVVARFGRSWSMGEPNALSMRMRGYGRGSTIYWRQGRDGLFNVKGIAKAVISRIEQDRDWDAESKRRNEEEAATTKAMKEALGDEWKGSHYPAMMVRKIDEEVGRKTGHGLVMTARMDDGKFYVDIEAKAVGVKDPNALFDAVMKLLLEQ